MSPFSKAAIVLVLAGCSAEDGAPDRAFRAFVSAAQEGRVGDAWSLLSRPTREAMQSQFDSLVAAGAKPAEDAAHMLFSGTEQLARPIREVAVVKEEGGSAVLKIVDGAGGSREVRMVKEDRGWRLDLASELERARR